MVIAGKVGFDANLEKKHGLLSKPRKVFYLFFFFFSFEFNNCEVNGRAINL